MTGTEGKRISPSASPVLAAPRSDPTTPGDAAGERPVHFPTLLFMAYA